METETLDLGFAQLDAGRAARTGMAETVFCQGKTTEQVVRIFRAFAEAGQPTLGTRCSPEQAAALLTHCPGVTHDPAARTVALSIPGKPPAVLPGLVAICSAGTADLPVAEEAAQTAQFFGAAVQRFYDIGVAGIHRLFARLEAIRAADVVLVVAGMEGALGSVVAGLVQAPVIAVPTSVGYGASFQGLAPLLSMLNACAEGLSVVNIDNGFGAAVQACRILRLRCPRPGQKGI